MPKSTVTNEHVSHEPNKAGCCGGDDVKGENSQSAQEKSAHPTSDRKPEHAQHAHGGSCCCGSGKASK